MLVSSRDVTKGSPRRRPKRRRYVIGKGLSDWIRPVVQAIGNVGKFVVANKDSISNVADVAGKVAKAGATTASSVKQIVDMVRSKARSSTRTTTDAPSGPEKVISEKSLEILRGLAVPPTAAARQNINARIAGSGFKKILY